MNVVHLKIAEERKDLLALFHNYLMTLLRSHLHMILCPKFPITT